MPFDSTDALPANLPSGLSRATGSRHLPSEKCNHRHEPHRAGGQGLGVQLAGDQGEVSRVSDATCTIRRKFGIEQDPLGREPMRNRRLGIPCRQAWMHGKAGPLDKCQEAGGSVMRNWQHSANLAGLRVGSLPDHRLPGDAGPTQPACRTLPGKRTKGGSVIEIAQRFFADTKIGCLRRVTLALTIAVSGASCSERSIAPPRAPGVPLSDVLNEINQEVAEYNREAAATPIRLTCNGHRTTSMRLIGVKAEVQSTIVNQMAGDVGPQGPPGAIPVLFNPSSAASALVTNRQTTTLNFDVPPARQGTLLSGNAMMPEHMNLLRALLAFREQLGRVTEDGLCMKFGYKEPASIAFDFTAEEQEKSGSKVKILVLTHDTASHTSSDRNMITVTLDMKGGSTEAASAPARRPVMPYFKETKHERGKLRHQGHLTRRNNGDTSSTMLSP
jgi:hypothetical protein